MNKIEQIEQILRCFKGEFSLLSNGSSSYLVFTHKINGRISSHKLHLNQEAEFLAQDLFLKLNKYITPNGAMYLLNNFGSQPEPEDELRICPLKKLSKDLFFARKAWEGELFIPGEYCHKVFIAGAYLILETSPEVEIFF